MTQAVSFTFTIPHTTGTDANGQETFSQACEVALEPFASVPGFDLGVGATPASVLDSERLACREQQGGGQACACVHYEAP